MFTPLNFLQQVALEILEGIGLVVEIGTALSQVEECISQYDFEEALEKLKGLINVIKTN